MLCPEVWNFKAPESSFSTQKIKPNETSHLNTVQNFIYNHLVSVILPDTFKVPESLKEALNDCDYYRINDVKVSEFVEKDVIDNFVNSGNLHVLSINSRIDCDNCIAITPTGQLILSLNKSDYQSLGLEGTVSHFHARTRERYIVTLDLKSKHYKPGKSLYERTKKCLEQLKQDVIVTWEPPNDKICPSSIAKYFQDRGYETKLSDIRKKTNTLYSVPVPSLEAENCSEVVEWLGMVALEGEFNGGPDNYLSTYQTPEPNRVIGQVKFMQWRGFFTANQIVRLYNTLRTIHNSEWLAMYVQGFSDSPVAWRGEEHHYYTNGDNGYILILNRDGSVISCTQKCSRKRYCNKRKGKPS